MKVKLILLLALTALFVSCSSDEPVPPASDSISQSEFEQLILGKTWVLKDVKFVDSQGHSFDDANTYRIYPTAYLFQTDGRVLRLFKPSDRFPASCSQDNWQYIADSGKLYIYQSKINLNDYLEIESVSSSELIVHSNFGCLMQGHPDMEDADVDEGSYARVVYEPLSDGRTSEEFWAPYAK